MQLLVIDKLKKKKEDQILSTNRFLQYLSEGKLIETIDGFDLKLLLIRNKMDRE